MPNEKHVVHCIWNTLDWDKKWLVDFNPGKTQIFSFRLPNNIGAIKVKMDESVFETKSSFKMLWLTFFFKLDWGFYIIRIPKSASKKIGSFFLLRFLCFSINLPYLNAWKTCFYVWVGVPSCYLELLDKLQKYAVLLTLPLSPILNPWLIVAM